MCDTTDINCHKDVTIVTLHYHCHTAAANQLVILLITRKMSFQSNCACFSTDCFCRRATTIVWIRLAIIGSFVISSYEGTEFVRKQMEEMARVVSAV